MDLADFFRKGLQNLHKDVLNKNYKKRSLLSRRESAMEARRQTRDTVMFNLRNIAKNMSPFITPNKNAEPEPKPSLKPKNIKPNERLEKLKQWRDKKNKQKEEEKKNAKPVFKVCHIDRTIGLPNLENVNKEIKGKKIKPLVPTIFSFAPVNHKFHPPHNLKPVQMVKPESRNLKQIQIVKPVTRSNAPSAITALSKLKPVQSAKLQLKSGTTKVDNDSRLERKKHLEQTKDKIKNTHSHAVKNNTPASISGANKKKKHSLKASTTKTMGWDVSQSSNIVEEHSSLKVNSTKKNQKTPVKPKKASVNPSNASVTNNEIQEFKTPNPNYLTPKVRLQRLTPLSKSKNKNTPAIKLNNKTVVEEKETTFDSIIVIDDDTDENEKVIIYDDDEITMKTPIKILRKSRLSSVRKSKSYGQNEDNFPTELSFTTPITENKSPRPRSSNSVKENDLSLVNTDLQQKTPKTKTLRSGRKSKTLNVDTRKSLETTPTTIVNKEPVYISPFVTISRGKDSARKEFNIRKSTGGTFTTSPEGQDLSKITSPQAGADYFERILDNHIAKIKSTCDTWNEYKLRSSISEEASSMIDVATGQSNLLITKKFEQFRGLISQCKQSEFAEKPITCEDLHGFWDMIYQQVIDLDKRFANLERLKNNDWKEVLPENKAAPKRVRGRPKKTATASASSSSSIREMIKAARNKIKTGDATESQLIEAKTPTKLPESDKQVSPIKTSSARRSLRVSLLRGSAIKRHSSPGLMIMKITQAIKSGDGLTPGKSILKTDSTRSVKRHTKSVLFLDDFDGKVSRNLDFGGEDKENSTKVANVSASKDVSVSDALTPTRKSRRLSKVT